MKWLTIKKIEMEIDDRDSNITAKDLFGKPIKFKQSKCTCKMIFQDKEENEYCWVAKNESLSEALKLISENEDKKYDVENKSWLLGRNMLFLAWLYEIWKTYLDKHGFNPPEDDLKKARKFKGGKENENT